MNRCGWARNDLAIRYHDEEWGVPVHDDRRWSPLPRSQM
jgi:DNA-3-methyladenine glycosylase I